MDLEAIAGLEVLSDVAGHAGRYDHDRSPGNRVDGTYGLDPWRFVRKLLEPQKGYEAHD
jgi:hypothetical protein